MAKYIVDVKDAGTNGRVHFKAKTSGVAEVIMEEAGL